MDALGLFVLLLLRTTLTNLKLIKLKDARLLVVLGRKQIIRLAR